MSQELNPLALEALKNNQRQLDADGCEVGVSRQALDELIAAYEALSALPDGVARDWTRRIARAWASIDGWTDEFDRESQPDVKYDAPEYTGHYEGYMSEAAELIRRAGLLSILSPSQPVAGGEAVTVEDGANSHCFDKRVMRGERCIAFADEPDASDIAAALTRPSPSGDAVREVLVKHMSQRFLQWRLPENFNPDGGISFKPEFNEHTSHPMRHQPVGTNLFDATQTEAMVRYMIDGCAALRSAPDILLDQIAAIRDEREAFEAGFSAGEAAGKFDDDTVEDAWTRYARSSQSDSYPAGVTDKMVDAAYNVFAGKMLMRDEDRDLIERMLVAALRSASPESQWRPITEAPHAIKLLIGWREPTGEWNCVVGQASWGHRDETTGISNRSWHGRATHWMPLPAAPSKGERP